MRLGFLLGLYLCATYLPAQRVINYEISVGGQIFLTEDIAIPKITRGYTLWIPATETIKGLIVFTHSRRDTAKSEPIIDYALSKQLAVLYATTENRLEFFFETEKLLEIEKYIHEATSTYSIPTDNMLYCGMSLEGTRALKLAIFGKSKHSKYNLIPKALAICDSPLDMVRFYREMVKAKQLDFNPAAANEGKWVSGYLETNLGGTPDDRLEAYLEYSPFSYSAKDQSKLLSLRDIAIRAYTEPDVNWWIENRRKDYYAMNATDLAALINNLQILGNKEAELVTTQNKGYLPDGARHPHSWSIVDEKAMIDWFLDLKK